ncbi:hypothetical protein B0H67DRAFT_257543 [Lasiosphaeris hirsuta]|uniref:Uncharacterized protein n=1 Tax=Lasiosphaeris hirsuta TaxID=260670 RepID=A0AA40DYC6_9PEZI|nr:hypothetical protein B0H67DRAFT_257543 [Lasiosphaeris hirsuta]
MSLTALLAFTGNYHCVDPRDRIYSLLGLVRAKDRAIVGQPNYDPRNTVEAVYMNFFVNFVQQLHSLDIICLSSLFRRQTTNPADTGEHQWPTWLPDWRVQIRPRTVPFMVSQPGRSHIGCFRPLPWPEIHGDCLAVFSASGSTQPSIDLDFTARAISCRAVYLDKIDGMAMGLFEGSDEWYNLATFVQSTSTANVAERDEMDPKNLATDIACTLSLDRGSQYLKDVAPVGKYRSELRRLGLTNPY